MFRPGEAFTCEAQSSSYYSYLPILFDKLTGLESPVQAILRSLVFNSEGAVVTMVIEELHATLVIDR